MKRTNTTLDREPMNSETIRQRQDFNYILKGASAAKVPIWKSIWFYGPVGIAMVTMVVSAVRINPKNELNDNNTTLAQNDVTGWTGSTNVSDLANKTPEELAKVEDDYSIEKSFVGNLNSTEITVKEKANNTVTTEKVDNNTELKPEVLAEEKIDIEPRKSVRVPVKKPRTNSMKIMPSIAGVFNGRISVGQICSDGRIECNNGFEVISYDIQYDNGAGSTVDRISSNKIPSYICSNLKRYNVGSPVFITKIIAMNEKGERKQLLSMNIEPTF